MISGDRCRFATKPQSNTSRVGEISAGVAVAYELKNDVLR